MRRRTFAAFVGAAALPSSNSSGLLAQPRALLRVGHASTQTLTDGNPARRAFVARMAELGYVEGRNFLYDFVTVAGPSEIVAGYASTIGRGAGILLAAGSQNALQGAREAAGDRLPIVFMAIDFDPIRSGYVASLARPGGNLTGIFVQQVELAEKRIEMARDALPKARRLALWWDYASREQAEAAAAAAAAGARGFEPHLIEASGQPPAFEAAFRRGESLGVEAVIVPASPVFFRERAEIARLALLHRVPLIAAFREFVSAGALFSYGVDLTDAYREAAAYIDRIARGAKPADLPIGQSTKFDLVLNLTTARALDITFSPVLHARADEVIE